MSDDAPRNDAPLEELLEAAEAAVSGPAFSPRTLVIALVTTTALLVVVSVTLAVAAGGRWGQETRLLELVVPRQVTPESYRGRIRIEKPTITMVQTPFDSQEIHVTGVLHNRGDRVLARADVEIRFQHLFRDDVFRYTFTPVTATAEGVDMPGPLLARGRRPFHYRIPDFPADVEERDVRVHWDVGTVEFHRGLPIPVPLPVATR